MYAGKLGPLDLAVLGPLIGTYKPGPLVGPDELRPLTVLKNLDNERASGSLIGHT